MHGHEGGTGMSILLKGMDMPKGNSTINVLIYSDGDVFTGAVNDADFSAVQSVDAVEVVRCKNCRHYGWTENRIPSEREWWCYKWDDAREETDFCSHAERREE